MWDVLTIYAIVMPMYFYSMHLRYKEYTVFNKFRRPLPDLGHRFFDINVWRKYHHIADILPVICVICLFIDDWINEHDLERIREYCLMHSTMYFIRTFTIHATTLPTCVPGAASKNYKARSYLGFIPSYDNDLMFSGHTTMSLMTLYFITNPVLFWFATFCAISCGILLIASREHYTVDVLVAFIASQALYSIRKNLIFWTDWYF